MMNCPKCGFRQQKDRFCANCGVDMDSYRPATPPMHVSLAKNWVFQVAVGIAVIVLGVAFIKSKHRSELLERLADVDIARSVRITGKKNPVAAKGAAETTNSTTTSAPAAPTQQAQADNAQAAGAAQSYGGTTAQPQQAASAAPVQTSISKLADSLAGDPTPPSKLKLLFAEVPRPVLTELMNDSRSVASYGTYFSALLPDHDDRIKNIGLGTTLDTANDLQLKLNQPIVVFKGTRDASLEQNLGLTTQITPVQIDDTGVHLQIEVHRVVRAPLGSNPPILDESFQEQFVLKNGSRAFMSGLFPHRVLTEEEIRNLANNSSILKVLASPDFQNNSSDFVLFVEAK